MSETNPSAQRVVINKDEFCSEIDAEQKKNHENIPGSDIAIGYHNGLTMAKAIALKLAKPTSVPTPTAQWEFGDPGIFGAEYVRCTRCGWKTAHVDPFLWKNHPGHKFCGCCGAKMK